MDELAVDNTRSAVGNRSFIPSVVPPSGYPVEGGGQRARRECACELDRKSVIHNPQTYYYC
jgi:hypothetical protein